MKTKNFGRILVATDGSDPANSALGLALTFARAADGRVLVVHVWNMEIHHKHGVWDVETRAEAQQLIDAAVSKVRSLGLSADGQVLHADSRNVATALAAAARQFDADLVVIGSRGLSDWQSLVRSRSVSHQMLTHVDCPVLVVRGPSSAAEPGPQRVLLAVAGGDDVRPAVDAATAAAVNPGSAVLVLHVPLSVFGAQGYAYVEPDEEVKQTVDRAVAMLGKAGVTASAVVAEGGPVVGNILEAASSWGADIIVIGSGRMGDVGSLLFGSVTHGLLQRSERPVLVAGRPRP